MAIESLLTYYYTNVTYYLIQCIHQGVYILAYIHTCNIHYSRDYSDNSMYADN